MAGNKSFFPFLLPAALAILFIFLLLAPDSRSASMLFISSFILALALGLSSWDVGMGKGLEYLLILPLPRGIGGWARIAKWSAAAFLLSCAATGAVSAVLYSLGLLDSGLVAEKILLLPIPSLVLASTLSPFAEEALFRGYFFRRISETVAGKGRAQSFFHLAAGATLSSLLFAFLHFSYGSVAEIAVAFSVGLVLCAVTRKSGSLLPAAFAHAAFNFLSIVTTVFL